MRFVDPSTQMNEGSPTIKMEDLPFLSISSASKSFTTEYDGFIGIAPYTGDQSDRDVSLNFMHYLKYDAQIIDHMIASIFITSEEDQPSSIKFGSYDK